MFHAPLTRTDPSRHSGWAVGAACRAGVPEILVAFLTFLLATRIMPSAIVSMEKLAASRPAAAASRRPVERHWTVVAVAGLVFMLVGWTDIALLWYPLRLKEVEWEFATITATVNALPLATVGLVFIAVAALAKGSIALSRVIAALCAGILLVLLALAGLYTLTLLAGYSAVDPAARPVLIRAVAKTSVLVVAYTFFHFWLGWTMLRSGRAKGSRE